MYKWCALVFGFMWWESVWHTGQSIHSHSVSGLRLTDYGVWCGLRHAIPIVLFGWQSLLICMVAFHGLWKYTRVIIFFSSVPFFCFWPNRAYATGACCMVNERIYSLCGVRQLGFRCLFIYSMYITTYKSFSAVSMFCRALFCCRNHHGRHTHTHALYIRYSLLKYTLISIN